MVNLQQLRLEDIGLSGLPDELRNLVLLQKLSLKKNYLSELPAQTLNALSNLQWLSLARNDLQNVNTLNLKNLKVLNLAETKLTLFPITLLSTCGSLKYIDISQNQISRMLPEHIATLSSANLSKVDFRRNVNISITNSLSLLEFVIL